MDFLRTFKDQDHRSCGFIKDTKGSKNVKTWFLKGYLRTKGPVKVASLRIFKQDLKTWIPYIPYFKHIKDQTGTQAVIPEVYKNNFRRTEGH